MAILSNVVMVGYEVNYIAKLQSKDHVYPAKFVILDAVYTVAFCIELLIRFLAQGSAFFSEANRTWNIFDVFIVMTSILDTAMSMATVLVSTDMSHMRVIRGMRIIRLVRTLRLIRLIRFIRALRTLVHSIIVTLKSLVWAMLLMLMTCYGFGVSLAQATSDHFLSVTFKDPMLEKFWITVPRSMYTLFQCVTAGRNWYEAVGPLVDLGWVWVVVFLAFITFTVFALLNVITGVFCQSAIESAQQDRDLLTINMMVHKAQLKTGITKLFNEIDADASGSLNIDEFETYLENEKAQAYFASLEIDTSDAWMLFKLLDTDNEGSVDIEEFVNGCIHLKGAASAIQVAKLESDHEMVFHEFMDLLESIDEQLSALCRWARIPSGAGARGDDNRRRDDCSTRSKQSMRSRCSNRTSMSAPSSRPSADPRTTLNTVPDGPEEIEKDLEPTF